MLIHVFFKLYDRLLLALLCLWTRIFPGLFKEVSFLSFLSCSLYLNLSKGVDYSFYVSVPLLWRCLGKTALSCHGIICSDDEWCPDCNLSVVCVSPICVCVCCLLSYISVVLCCAVCLLETVFQGSLWYFELYFLTLFHNIGWWLANVFFGYLKYRSRLNW